MVGTTSATNLLNFVNVKLVGVLNNLVVACIVMNTF